MSSHGQSSLQKDLISSDDDGDQPPPLHELRAIAEYGFRYWRERGDRERGIVTLIVGLSRPQRNAVRDFIITHEEAEIWDGMLCFAENPGCQALQTHLILNCVGDLTWLFWVFLTATRSTERWCAGMLPELQSGYMGRQLAALLVLCYQTLANLSQG